MPAMSKHQSRKTTKLLLTGDSGTGKTGSLVSLAKAGYNLRILDLDNGLDILVNLLQEAQVQGLDDPARFCFETVTDKYKERGGALVPVQATAWPRTTKLLTSWSNKTFPDVEEEDKYDLGPISEWTDRDVLVIDSLSFLSRNALNYILQLNSRLGQQPHQSDWYHAQNLVEGFLSTIHSDAVKCNVIMTAHITIIEQNNIERAYPNSLGKALPPKVGQYFNSMLEVRRQGVGVGTKRLIHTIPAGTLDLKNPNPSRVKPSYPIETGLADFFAIVRGEE